LRAVRAILAHLPPMLALAIGLAAAGAASAQDWPSARPVTLVVGTPAGGAVDAYARALAEALGRIAGGTYVIENRPGANGNLSAEAVLKAPADGHTLWIGTQAMVTINPSAYPQLRWKPSDFTPVIKGVEAPLVLVTHPGVPAATLDELTRWARAEPGRAAYASFSPGTPSHFLGFQLNERLGLDMVHVPYKGSAPQVSDLLGGQVPLGFTQLQTAVPHIEAGKLRAIAVTGPERSRFLPTVPTLTELGQGELTATIWFGVFASSATPQPVIQSIAAAAQRVQADPAFRAKLEAQRFDVARESGTDFAASIRTESERWARVIKATGFSAAD